MTPSSGGFQDLKRRLDRGEALPFEKNCFTEICSDSEAVSYSRPMDFLYHSNLGLRAIHKKGIGHPDGSRPCVCVCLCV